ncbi:hypothetical protein CCR75_002009 [Bremia lactucae]|uniref:RING-type domain-containing protein n=1 Tax=Bremia lactucae TaxID=4779 RepID=A0A976FIE7_BRELC|nr:hypothetical protein CCR75_002009 [Bremia lactucae]
MDEAADSYGFGSFSELFDRSPAQIAKHLDLGALSPFFMSERLLSRFRRHRHRDERSALHHHVAAKFNGVGINGGLGSLDVVPLKMGGGFVWMQSSQSESDACRRRKKELQDITNQQTQGDDYKSVDVLHVPMKYVTSVQPSSLQKRAQGVEVILMGHNRFEFTFMPGPFACPTHRDDFLQALEKQALDKQAHDGSKYSVKCTPVAAERHERIKPKVKTPDETATSQKVKFRRLVRKHTKLEAMSVEAIDIAKTVHAGTYQLGALAAKILKYSEGAEYCTENVEKLADNLKQIKQESQEADAHRTTHMKVNYSKNIDGLFEYSEKVTGMLMSSAAYEQRYLEYLETHEINHVTKMHPVQDKKECQHILKHHINELAVSTESAKTLYMETLGIDISSSSIVDADFFRSVSNKSSGSQICKNDKTPFRTAVDNARIKLWNSWAEEFTQVFQTTNLEPRISERNTQSTSPLPVSRKKRTRYNRQSDMFSNLENFDPNAKENLDEGTENNNTSISSGAKGQKLRAKDSRVLAKSRRNTSRQSVMFSPLDETASRETLRQSRKPIQPSYRINKYPCKASSLEMVVENDSSLCQLCYSDEAIVHMEPCGHAVCGLCWSRLSPSPKKAGEKSHRLCPWDREVVTKK